MAVDVLWFKKDLRIRDHQPLIEATKSGNNLLCLFLVEPERLELEDTDHIHIEWELDNAEELAKSLAAIGGHLHIKFENAIKVMQSIHEEFEIGRILSHQETGNSWSYQRDIQVKDWCNSNKVEWLEFPSNGVIRGLTDRDLWKKKRDSRMRIDLQGSPNIENKSIPISNTFDRTSIGLNPRKLSFKREAGEAAAEYRLVEFLQTEAKNFQWGISSPVNAVKFGSGLSPYLTVGAISMRRVVQTTNNRMHEIRTDPSIVDDAKMWLRSLASFRKRLAWRCHFIQKLEMESDLDIVAQNKIIDSNLNRVMDEERFNRWKTGTTGWPFLDACMRQLASTGWINFRMRAMIMSAASYNLWLPWRDTGCHLA
ncbi:MAG: FAD-binding domain-containing protein, partial [Candidatus Poseidoniaceae archaeon]